MQFRNNKTFFLIAIIIPSVIIASFFIITYEVCVTITPPKQIVSSSSITYDESLDIYYPQDYKQCISIWEGIMLQQHYDISIQDCTEDHTTFVSNVYNHDFNHDNADTMYLVPNSRDLSFIVTSNFNHDNADTMYLVQQCTLYQDGFW